MASYWPEVLAIFAVHTNLNSDSDVVVINAAQMQRIQGHLWRYRHEITYEVEEVDTTPEPTEDDPDPEQQTDYILHITVSSKTVDELAELYNFTQDQKDILHQLLSEEMRPSLLALCGGIAVPMASCRWPLAGAHLYILPLRGSGRLRQCRASRHRYSRTGGNTHLGCPQRHGAGQRLERQLRQSGAAG